MTQLGALTLPRVSLGPHLDLNGPIAALKRDLLGKPGQELANDAPARIDLEAVPVDPHRGRLHRMTIEVVEHVVRVLVSDHDHLIGVGFRLDLSRARTCPETPASFSCASG